MKNYVLAACSAVIMLMGGIISVLADDPQANCTPIGGIPGHPNDDKNSKGNADPVDASMGAVIFSRTDISLPGPAPLTFTRTYDSSLGSAWFDNCHQYLTFGNGAAGYWQGDGVCVPIYLTAHVDGDILQCLRQDFDSEKAFSKRHACKRAR